MSTTNDTRPKVEPGFNWETYARQLEVKQDALHAELRAADAAIGARTKVFYAQLAAERAIKAELVAALKSALGCMDSLAVCVFDCKIPRGDLLDPRNAATIKTARAALEKASK